MKHILRILAVACALACVVSLTSLAYASESSELSSESDLATLAYLSESDVTTEEVVISSEGKSASVEGISFSVENFSRAQKGSYREVDDEYLGYSYYQGSSPDYVVAVATESCVLVYVPSSLSEFVDAESAESQDALKAYFLSLDVLSAGGGSELTCDIPWYFTNETTITIDDLQYSFAVLVGEGSYYVTVNGLDEQGITLSEEETITTPSHVDFFTIAASEDVEVIPASTGIAAAIEFVQDIDYSPLWVTLKTTGTAIVFIFVLGLLAAYFSLRLPKRAQDIADTIFTIPMVLPPTVCGFLLLLGLGSNTALGQWFINIGFPLIFSWQATVIAAVVVAFPLMYRSARGAFESLDQDMLDAARTLGWSNIKIFFRLMLPLSWSSIAAGTVLAFARALGEFGATLFLAGNYLGVTRTIPIAIYFEWMNGNTDVAMFWTAIILVFSFIVILCVNIISKRATKYRCTSAE